MLEKLSKKQKDGFYTILILTGLFVSGSTPMYDVNSSSAEAAGSMFAPILKPQPLEQTNRVPLQREANIIVQIPTIGRMSNRIDELESTIEAKDFKIAAMKEQKDVELAQLRDVYVSMDQALIDLSQYVGKSPYGFGDDPQRWDCSGLTLWFYAKYRGIDLPHSATDQMRGGVKVDAPIPGDLVAFSYGRSKSAFHIGVYMGGGMFIHAKNHSADTVLERVDHFASKNITVAYIRY